MEVHQHGSFILGSVNLRKIYQQTSEAWEDAQPVELKLGKVSSLFISYNITMSRIYPLHGQFELIFV